MLVGGQGLILNMNDLALAVQQKKQGLDCS